MISAAKIKAAKHSVEAMALYHAARSLRRAAMDCLVAEEQSIAAECRAIARRLDARRRAMVDPRQGTGRRT